MWNAEVRSVGDERRDAGRWFDVLNLIKQRKVISEKKMKYGWIVVAVIYAPYRFCKICDCFWQKRNVRTTRWLSYKVNQKGAAII